MTDQLLPYEFGTSIVKYLFEVFVGLVFIFDVIKLIQIKEAKTGPLDRAQRIKMVLILFIFFL